MSKKDRLGWAFVDALVRRNASACGLRPRRSRPDGRFALVSCKDADAVGGRALRSKWCDVEGFCFGTGNPLEALPRSPSFGGTRLRHLRFASMSRKVADPVGGRALRSEWCDVEGFCFGTGNPLEALPRSPSSGGHGCAIFASLQCRASSPTLSAVALCAPDGVTWKGFASER